MTHEEASLILVDRLHGRLDAGARARVDDHAASCEACGAALETLRHLAGPRTHLPADRIVEIALGEGDPDLGHLGTCRSCAAEVAACRASVLEARAGRAGAAGWRPRPLRPFIPSALAAALLVAILGYPAYRGLVDLPRARRQAEAAAEAEALSKSEASSLRAALEKERAATPAPDKGEVGFALYLDATRGAPGRAPAMELRPETRVVTILLEPLVLRSTAVSGPLRFEIRDRDGRVVWSNDTTAGAIRARQGASVRLLTLLVPAQALPPGEYTLTLGRPGTGGVEKVIEAPFEITAPAPQ